VSRNIQIYCRCGRKQAIGVCFFVLLGEGREEEEEEGR